MLVVLVFVGGDCALCVAHCVLSVVCGVCIVDRRLWLAVVCYLFVVDLFQLFAVWRLRVAVRGLLLLSLFVAR